MKAHAEAATNLMASSLWGYSARPLGAVTNEAPFQLLDRPFNLVQQAVYSKLHALADNGVVTITLGMANVQQRLSKPGM
ncbi:MAG: hypothetical protein BZY75_00270 [SAR202 cluster bacterium Io17-Chloro-G7]|nr:MAG: hypothetical protein BZY75_00270 [SAR202 cluster bacterium Io17-Chloro-G7]